MIRYDGIFLMTDKFYATFDTREGVVPTRLDTMGDDKEK